MKDKQTAKELIKISLAANQPILIRGKRGTGKSETVKAICRQEGYTCIVRNLNGAESYEVVAGLPRQDGQSFNYLIPMWWKDVEQMVKTGQKVCIFLDEINHAMPEVLNGLHGVLDPERRIAGLEIPDVRIIAAGNMAEENETITEMPLPLMDRFAIVIDDFINEEAESYLVNQYPDAPGIIKMIFASIKPNPRMVEKLIKCIRCGMTDIRQLTRMLNGNEQISRQIYEEIKNGNYKFDLIDESDSFSKRRRIIQQIKSLDEVEAVILADEMQKN